MKNKINIPIVSVIVPVYNTSKFLKKCLNSILNQTFKSIEVILVNDGSTDNSLAICEIFKLKDPRIIIIDKSNEGVELARKSGEKIAKGDFITYVDSDDWLAKNALQKLYSEAIKFDADIVVGNHYKVLDKFGLIKQKKSAVTFDKIISVPNELFMKKYYKNFFGINLFPVSMWGRIYKKSFLDTIELNLLGFNMGEDLVYNMQVFPNAKNIVFIPDFVYYYRFGGMTSNYNEKIIQAALQMYILKKEMIYKYNYHFINKYIIYELKNYLATYIEMLIRFKPYSVEENRRRINELIDNNEYTEVIDFYKNNKKVQDEFVNALMKKDVLMLETIIQKRYHNKKYGLLFKKFISKILN
jgi:glycosyltransferase involved in cell wall biosynthesis